MTKVRLGRFCLIAALATNTIFIASLHWSPLVSATEWFDSFAKLSRNDEKARLYNFGLSLRMNPDTIGYIAYCVGPKDSRAEIKDRKEWGAKYLVSDIKIPKSRIRIVDSGPCKETWTILQPWPKTDPPPKFF